MEIPDSMKADLGAWNDGAGIDLESWIGCEGGFGLAVGYASLFWPEFVEFEGYVLRKDFSEECLRDWESQPGCTRKGTESIMNHLHIADVQHYDCPDISKDKITLLGNVLKEIYEAKLKFIFPERPCIVDLYIPEDKDNLIEYELSFWQSIHETQDV